MRRALFACLAALLLAACPALCEGARVIDEARLLSAEEISDLEAEIASIREEYAFDVVLLTTEDTSDKSPRDYAADYYDYGGFGVGDERDGLLFLVSMAERDFFTLTTGRGIDVFTDYATEKMHEDMLPSLSDGAYFDALSTYLADARECLAQAEAGAPYDVDNPIDEYARDVTDAAPNEPRSPFEIANDYLIAIGVVSLLAAAVTVIALIAKMRTRAFRRSARDYVVDGSFVVTTAQDFYLYTTTTRTLIEDENSKGGSGTFTGSSGTTHGGSGGKF